MREYFANLLLAAQIASTPEEANNLLRGYIRSVVELRNPYGVGEF